MSLGTSLAGRLTSDLILRSPQYMNPCGEYELEMRGNKISTIENLGATENQFDAIDLSDNEIVKLEGFPLLPRLKTLLLNNNRINRVGLNLQERIPNMDTIVLTGNRINNITDLKNLSGLKKLKRLVILSNPIVRQANYRLKVINALPQLKMLDFFKVKADERKAAETVYELGEVGTKEDAGDGAEGMDVDEPAGNGKPGAVDITAIKAAIANAETMEEVERLEAALQTGQMPADLVAS